jgi:hypothetical protein
LTAYHGRTHDAISSSRKRLRNCRREITTTTSSRAANLLKASQLSRWAAALLARWRYCWLERPFGFFAYEEFRVLSRCQSAGARWQS